MYPLTLSNECNENVLSDGGNFYKREMVNIQNQHYYRINESPKASYNKPYSDTGYIRGCDSNRLPHTVIVNVIGKKTGNWFYYQYLNTKRCREYLYDIILNNMGPKTI